MRYGLSLPNFADCESRVTWVTPQEPHFERVRAGPPRV